MEPLGVQDRFKTKILKFDTFKFTKPKLQYTIIIEVEDFPRFPSTQVLLGDKIFTFGLVYVRPINPDEYKIKNIIGIASSEPVNVKGEIEDIVFLKMSDEEIEEIKRNQKKKRRKNK